MTTPSSRMTDNSLTEIALRIEQYLAKLEQHLAEAGQRNAQVDRKYEQDKEQSNRRYADYLARQRQLARATFKQEFDPDDDPLPWRRL